MAQSSLDDKRSNEAAEKKMENGSKEDKKEKMTVESLSRVFSDPFFPYISNMYLRTLSMLIVLQ
jgi:hypothetical protein